MKSVNKLLPNKKFNTDKAQNENTIEDKVLPDTDFDFHKSYASFGHSLSKVSRGHLITILIPSISCYNCCVYYTATAAHMTSMKRAV